MTVCQKPSEATRSNQEASRAITSHQEQPGATRANQELSGATRNDQEHRKAGNSQVDGSRSLSVHALFLFSLFFPKQLVCKGPPYVFYDPVRALRGAKCGARPFLEHFVYKTNGFSMILNFFYSMAQVKIIFCFKIAKTLVFPMLFAPWSHVADFIVVSLHVVSRG